jgi:hypothetical protein
MADKIFRLTNGVSFGAMYTITAADATANQINFVFKALDKDTPVPYPLVASVLITRAGVNIPLGDTVITYPANGTILVHDGATTMLTAGDVISIVAQRADTSVE